ncbi:MAG: ZIP family metal transporter [Clostridia bacterium]|nr:ZIP family metal transporter [Clostridia bacterium]
MHRSALFGILLPCLFTALGAAGVCLLRGVRPAFSRICAAGAAGIMTAAAIWSLLLPALEACSKAGRLAFLPPLCGIWLGVALMRGADGALRRLRTRAGHGGRGMSGTAMLFFSVTVHNIPEGMAVGAAYAAANAAGGTEAAAFALALGIAIQNLPEGAILSLPLYAGGRSKPRAFLLGALSGMVEPLAAVLTLLLAALLVPLLPCLLGLAAGAMLFVVADALLPEAAQGGRHLQAALLFLLGFSVMMVLDVALH